MWEITDLFETSENPKALHKVNTLLGFAVDNILAQQVNTRHISKMYP